MIPWAYRDRRLRLAALMLAAAAVARPAAAAEPRLRVEIPVQPRKPALMALAKQADLSIGFASDLDCPGHAGAVGRMTAPEALALLLDGSPCEAQRIDPHTYAIRRRSTSVARTAPAAGDTAAPAAKLDELVVTAGKRPATLRSAPYAITALTAQDLQRQDIRETADLASLVAGVVVTNLGPGRNKLLLRGLSDSPLTGHTQASVGIYLDELRLTYNTPDPDLSWVDVARVEVLRGPQGSLYGSGSIGGILHIVPNAPDPSARYGWVSARAAATADGAPSHGFEGMLNAPLGAAMTARVAAWWDEDGGYIDNLATGRSDVDLTRRHGVRATLAWRASPDLALTAGLVQQGIISRDTHYAQPIGVYARAVPTAEPHDNDFSAVDVTARWTPTWGEITATAGLLDHGVASRYDAALAPQALAAPGDTPRAYEDNNHVKAVVSEARATSGGAGPWRWLAGAFLSVADQDLSGAMLGQSGTVGYREARRDRLFESALFGESSLELTPRWTLTAGARVFRSRVTTGSAVAQAGQARDFSGAVNAFGVAPKLLVAYRPTGDLTFYLQASEGYRSGGFNSAGPLGQVFGVHEGDTQPLRRYGGDELWSYEAGLRFEPGEALAARAALFHADWYDIQADLLLPSGLPFTANVGDGRTDGLEVEGRFHRGALQLDANLVLQQPELNHPDPGFPARADTGLPGVPNISYGLAASYSGDLGGGWSYDAAARYSYVGPSHLTFDAATAPRMGGYGELHASLAVVSGRYRAELYGDNLAGSHGNTFAYGNPFSLRAIRQSTPQRPRTLGVRLTRDF